MKERYRQKKRQDKKSKVSLENKKDSKKQMKIQDESIKLEWKKEKQKIYNARAYAKRRSLKNKGLTSKKQNFSLKDEKELVFKINNPEKKTITIRIDL